MYGKQSRSAIYRCLERAFVAMDRATRYVHLEIDPKRNAETSAGFLERFLAHFAKPFTPS
jgi:hypothetical protein